MIQLQISITYCISHYCHRNLNTQIHTFLIYYQGNNILTSHTINLYSLLNLYYFNNLVHGTYGLTSHRKDEAIMVKRLAQGHKRRDQPGRESDALDRSVTTLHNLMLSW